jgi:hypothetical protein
MLRISNRKESNCPSSVPIPPITTCVTSGKLSRCSVPMSSHLENVSNNSILLMGLLKGLNDLVL